MAKLTFLGAAGSVTGSKYLVEAAGKRLLVDCGIFQGAQELQDRNYKPLPVDPKTIDYLVLTHAHLDHTGWLPVLAKSGYRGPIFANPATIELVTILLKDSAHLQQEDTLHARIHKDSRHSNPEPLYTAEDVDPTLKLIKTMPRSGSFDISPEFRVTSYDAGHILGSSSLELTITEGGKKTVVVFSGDIGRYNQAILKDPATPPSHADVLICESTYGDREHPEGDPAELLAQIDCRTRLRKVEVKLRESEERYALVTEATHDGVFQFNALDRLHWMGQHRTECNAGAKTDHEHLVAVRRQH